MNPSSPGDVGDQLGLVTTELHVSSVSVSLYEYKAKGSYPAASPALPLFLLHQPLQQYMGPLAITGSTVREITAYSKAHSNSG